MKDKKTNTEFVEHMMNYSDYGVMSQLFILIAIEKYAEMVLKNKEDVLKQMENSIINGESWVGVAEEVLHKIKSR